VREIQQNAALELAPLGFLDDDPRKRRLTIDGLPVLGDLGDLERLLDAPPRRVITVVVAIADLPPATFDRICAVCAERGVAVRRMRVGLEEVKRRADPDQRVVGFPRT
jgi:FlaA1/EpsC-like NDP-sugar epimerase